MLDKIILFSIKNKLLIGLFTLALVAWGGYSLSRIPIDALPDITNNQVMIITVSPTLAPEETERLVTFPVEQAMTTIPGMHHMRSMSRFGLSIVTLVFEEHVDVYWARQQVSERLPQVTDIIPKGVGKPELAPITTGLGEIYQYVLHTKKGYEHKYSSTDLRTIQDWIVKRQLLGTPGVAEVSALGGFVKQYQIAVDPDRMRSMNVTISDIFAALEANNQNTGGAYIDKRPNAYFIRTEGLVQSLDDIERIVVRKEGDRPVLVRDVATVGFGHGSRYGAATRNAQGEVVTGIVLMLKGANSSAVIDGVKERIERIQKTLPEGVVIEPFLDRQKLVDNAIHTVSKNLIEGALIVIFILILFLGDLRAGLVVASVIPLAMLFALGMMNIFGVSGNLMSLGAIDFGLIVDGAVIIVEAILHRLHLRKTVQRLTQPQMDEEVHIAAVGIRNSASFGEIIILVVYLPILALVGIEGKMFRPMAQTVSFAILGAFILSLTYVPMMSALALGKQVSHKRTIADRLMAVFHRAYDPLIRWALGNKTIVVGTAVALLTASLFVFSSLGGEFIPQLDEGDFAVETRVLTGSSIDQMIEVSAKAQKIMLGFPEVSQVVNKIGSGEVPTDPMPIEAGDMMVILKDTKEWTTAHSREELAQIMQDSLAVIPEATFGFQQPIQMRFNELITGAKQDVVIKIYGDDLNALADLAARLAKLIRPVDGVEDLYVEAVTGLPQIQVRFDRDRLAQYDLNIATVNQAIRTAFAGEASGLVYEGEKRFELVVRLDSTSRTDITDVSNLYVPTPDGRQVPVSEVATVSYEPGPNQIQRDDAKRRITLGFNVRKRDVESIIGDIRLKVDKGLKLPTGYYLTYGGAFENLVAAKNRLAIAVPVALLLILVLLYLTFNSLRQGVLIFTAIPLSAIGGIFALWLRGMPFSISAGVGFIALFGVAVLNGLVLIGEFNRLKASGVSDIFERIRQGTATRLRPVLMTASVASLGFLPMALSHTAGAEVQRPLATVVIGGLVSATLLTLVVLPVLYLLEEGRQKGKASKGAAAAVLMLIGFLASPSKAQAQSALQATSSRALSLQDAIAEAQKNNDITRISAYETSIQQRLRSASVALPKLDVVYSQGNINSPLRDNSVGISQRLDFPTVYAAQSRLTRARIATSEVQQQVRANELAGQVKAAYYELVYHQARYAFLLRQDSLFNRLQKASEARYRTGETTRLESVTSAAQALEVKSRLLQTQADIRIVAQRLKTLLNTQDDVTAQPQTLQRLDLAIPADSQALSSNPTLRLLKQERLAQHQETVLQRQRMLPDLFLGYLNQSFTGYQNVDGVTRYYGLGTRFSYVQGGLSIPVFPGGNRARIKAARISEDLAQARISYQEKQLRGRLRELLQQRDKHGTTLDYYQQTALPQASLVIDNAEKGFRAGEIAYTQYVQAVTLALRIQSDYLDNLFAYNATVIELATLLNLN